MSVRFPSLLALLTVLFLSGCGREKIETYRVPKEADDQPATETATPPPAAAPAMPAPAGPMTGNMPVASGPGLAWTAPADWKEYAPTSMRKANFKLAGPEGEADLSVTAFPGNVGGELANVNRWRGQTGLGPVGDADLAGAVTRLSVGSLAITVVDADGPSAHLLGAIVPVGDGTWFFKLTGPSPLVARQKAAFLSFLQTVRPASAP